MRHFSPRQAILLLVLAIVAPRANAACTTTYTLTPTPPAAANWTDPSIWSPVGFPGSAAGDCVDSGSATPTNIVVDSALPNPIEDLQWHCSSCNIEITAGGQLTVQTSGALNTGIIAIDGGTLVVNAPGPEGLTLGSGTFLDLRNGTLNIAGTLSGAGTLVVNAGTLTLAGLAEIDNFVMRGGVVTGGGFLSAAATFDWSGGTLAGTGTTQIEGTGSGIFDGADGTMVLDGRPFDNYGSISFTALTNPLQLGNGAIFSNYGSFGIMDDGDITCDCTTPPLFHNSPNGDFYKAGNNGTTTIDVPFDNDYGVIIFYGTLAFNGNGTHNGNFFGIAGTELLFTASHTFDNSSLYSEGTVSFVGGTALINSSYEVKGLTTLDGGSLTINSPSAKTKDFTLVTGTLVVEDFAITGDGTWSCGTIDGTSFTVAAGATLTIDGANSDMFLVVDTLTNDGTILYTATDLSGNWLTFDGGALVNNGLFDIQGDAPIDLFAIIVLEQSSAAVVVGPAGNSITNAGTFQKSIDTGTTLVVPDFFNTGTLAAQSGIIDFQNTLEQSAGSTSLEGGSIAGALNLTGGTLVGTGLFDGPVTNNGGEVAPGSPTTTGVIDMLDYTQGAGGTLSIRLEGSAAGQFDQVNAANVTLDGTFTATLLNGYEPLDGTTFDVLTFSTRSGVFATETLPVYQVPHGSIGASYQAAAYQLLATVTPPSANLTIGMSGPATVDAGSPLSYVISVGNSGPDGIGSTITVTNTLPAGATSASGSGTGWSCGAPIAGVITCTSATPLPNGQSLPSLTIAMTAPATAGSIQNAATASSSVADPATPNTAGVTTTVVAVSDLQITKNGPGGVTPGQLIVYTIVVTNNGPSTANSVSVTDPTPAGLLFVSNSGACITAFPCALGLLTSGQSVTITSTFQVPVGFAGASITNTASVNSVTLDLTSGNNSSTIVTPVTTGAFADLSIVKQGPFTVTAGSTASFSLTIRNNGPTVATGVTVADPTPAGLTFLSSTGACPSGFPCAIASLNPGQTVVAEASYLVQAIPGATITNTATISAAGTDPDSTNDTSSASVEIVATALCPQSAPALLGPAGNANVSSPVTLSWSAIAAADRYLLTIDGPEPMTVFVTATTTSVPLAPGSYTWTVGAVGTDCPILTSGSSAFVVCGASLEAPAAGAVAETTTGQTYHVSWNTIPGAQQYELQESSDAAFTAPQAFVQSETTRPFTKVAATPTAFHYRVRALPECGSPGAFSPVVRVVVLPVPSPTTTNFNVNVPAGSTTPVTFRIFVPGPSEGSAPFVATVDKPWLSVVPTSGIITPAGVFLTITADPTELVNGTWTGTVLLAYGSVSVAGSLAAQATSPTFSIPVSISLVTPIVPGEFSEPSDGALIIPAVGHLAGVDSAWRSDVRIANTSASPANYRLRFNIGSGDPSTLLSATVLTVDAGSTVALDNLVRAWFGTGSLGESSNGALIIEPLDADGKATPVLSPTTSVSSRTFNASANGTFGQFIPALPFAGFITRALSGGAAPTLSLQQISQSDALRTNLGLLEASGRPVSALVSVFNGAGLKLFDLPLQLGGGQQQQLNSFLANNGIALPNGRIEARVIEGDGKITAYASVVDNVTNDPFLVFGVPLGGAGANRYVLPGVADLETGVATWRSDVRLFNASLVPQLATLTFFPAGEPGNSSSREVPIAPGEVKALDGVLRSLFGLTNAGGALHVTTPDGAPLIVSARTFDQHPGGTVGQFVPAVAPNEAVGLGERALQVLQAEESVRYRTNLGIAEVSGHASVVEIEVTLPDSKVRPVVTVPLAANEFRQFPVLSNFGLGAVYNARIAIRVIEGEGRVTAYGSVIDRLTGDPTYIPPQ